MDHSPENPGRTPDEDATGRAPEDEALARLHAADPAAATGAPVLDAAALRDSVDRRIAAGATPGADLLAEGGDGDGEAATVTTLRSRRPARWLQVAAVVAGIAVVGGGSYALGRSGGDGATAASSAIVLDQSGSQPLAAAESAAADSRVASWFGGRTVFTAAGLPDDAGTAHAWAFDGASVFSAETAARIATALGVSGDPTLQWGSWTVGPTDGSGPSVTLQPDGTAGVSYYDPTRDPWSCTVSAPDQPGTGAADGSAADGATASGAATLDGSTDVPSVGAIDPGLLEQEQVDPSFSATIAPCDPAAAPAPTGDAALGQVRDLLTLLGVDPAGFEIVVEDTGDDTRSSQVTANQVVDGQRTGLAWSFTLVDGGVQSLYGFLAPLVDLGEYPVVGAATAVDRLGDPRFGPSSGGVMPLARAEATDGAVTDDSVASDDPTVPTTAAPGAAISWPVQQVTITGARLGVTQVVQADGAALLVPAYELTGDDGSTWSVVAVAEASLDLAG